MPIHLDCPHPDREAHAVEIDPDSIHWAAVGAPDPMTHLLAVARIGGVCHHLEAYQIEPDGTCSDPGLEPKLEALYQLAGEGGGHFDTVSVDSLEYVLTLQPFQ